MRPVDKPYTDHELGFIQDHAHWTAAQIAKEIGRTQGSVKQKRRMMRAGWAPAAHPEWTKAEDEFLLANPRMSQSDAAAHLGRTSNAINVRRRNLRKRGITNLSFGGNWSPTTIGSRPLLARTCPACGLLLQAKWFNADKGGCRTSLCNRCRYANGSKRPPRQAKRDYHSKLQEITKGGASRAGQPWIESDFKVLSDPDMTVLQKALALHRTYHATHHACRAGGFKSHVGLGDPERDQWMIDNPNAGNVEEITASLAPLNPLAPAKAKQPAAHQWDWDESDLKVSA